MVGRWWLGAVLLVGCTVDTYSSDEVTDCERNADCDGELVCIEGASGNGWGTCEPPLQLGDACVEWQCEVGLYCTDTTPDNVDATMVCVQGDRVGAPCMGHRTCATRYCPAGHCAEPPGLGEPCPARICADDYGCIDGTCIE